MWCQLRQLTSLTFQDPREIHHYFNSLKARNEHEAKEIDNVFLRRQDRDAQTNEIERNLQQVRCVRMASWVQPFVAFPCGRANRGDAWPYTTSSNTRRQPK